MKRYAAQFTAVALVAGAWQLARPPASEAGDLGDLTFAREALNATQTNRTVRQVAPAYEGIRSWISSVGAAVALSDVDGNGKPDDACIVDTRDDSVTVRPVGDTRYESMRLDPAPLPYDATMAPMGCVPSDLTEDGRTDVLVYYWGRSPVLFVRTPRGFRPQEVVTPYQVWNSNAATVADIDGDGHTDVVVGNYFPDGARVLDPKADQPELQMQRSMSNADNGGTNQVILFTQGGRPSTHPLPGDAGGWTLALGAQDLDGDSLPELYVANDFGPDRLLRNQSTPGKLAFKQMEGIRHASTPKSKVLGRDSFKGMGVAFTDLNADTVPDMVVSNITEQFALHESNFAWLSRREAGVLDADGTAYYDDHSEDLGLSRSGWGWDIKAGDFAGKGDPAILQATGFVKGETNRWPELQELAMSNDHVLDKPRLWPNFGPGDDLSGHDPDRFWVRNADGGFTDVAGRLGVADKGVSRGLALADVDHDGRLDYAVAGQWRPSYLYRNTRTTSRPYLGLRLMRPAGCSGHQRPGALVPAIGASVLLESGAAGLRTGQLYPANGHAGVSASELLFALGNEPTARVAVTWRDGCGIRHVGRTTLEPGWHDLRLGYDAMIKEGSR